MARALELAALGRGHTSPNPMVGCVIVHENEVIGEGWHRQFGGPHAEVNALNSINDKELLRQSTVYVTLEPCSHHGKTPPCADLLVSHQIKEVIIANADPNPLVAGSGIEKMKAANIPVKTGILESEGEALNKRFFTYFREKRPFILLKWAETADGFIARENFDSKWISNEWSRTLVHKWRTEEDAILVGTHTAEYDDPMLNARDWPGKNPVRLVIDMHGMLDKSLHLFDGQIPTVCYTLEKKLGSSQNLEFVQCSKDHFLEDLVSDVYQRKILSVMVEGGSRTLQHFIDKNLWDEVRVFRTNKTFGRGIPRPALHHAECSGKDVIMDDELWYFKHE